MTTLELIKAILSTNARAVINAIWDYRVMSDEWEAWMSSESLYRKFAKSGESRQFGKKFVQEALYSLNGSIIFEHEQQGSYQLTFLGALLTDDCNDGIEMLMSYLQLVQSAFDSGVELNDIRIKNTDIEKELNISGHKLRVLKRLLQRCPFAGVSGNIETWEVTIYQNAKDLLVEDNLSLYIEQQALKDYDPLLPIHYREQLSYKSKNQIININNEPIFIQNNPQEGASDKDTMEPRIDPYRFVDTVIDNEYRILEFIGVGGMGVVYKARTKNNKDVAVKFLKPDVATRDRKYIQLFTEEVTMVRQLDHPNIVKVIDSGISTGIPYMVMDFLDGIVIEDFIKSRKPIEKITVLFKQICDAVDYAHGKRILHLDLKPANIFLISNDDGNEIVKVIDFGLSRVLTADSKTTITHFAGTPQYSSPEHYGGKVSARTDVYSLGVTLYEMLSGVMPIGGSYINALQRGAQLPAPPTLRGFYPDLATELDAVIEKALKKDPSERHKSAIELFSHFKEAISISKKKSSKIQKTKNITPAFNYQHYVPILKGKEGEYGALKELDSPIKNRITPLIEIPPIPWDFKNNVPAKTIDKHIEKVASKIFLSWGNTSAFFLDLLWIADEERLNDGKEPIIFICECARKKNLQLIPVTGLRRSCDYQTAIKAVMSQDERGCCIRIENEDFRDLGTLGGNIERLLNELEIVPEMVDLLLDFKEITESLTSAITIATVATISSIPHLNRWHTLTFAGTGFPPDLQKVPPLSIKSIKRTEWVVWNSLISSDSHIQRRPAFGDYGIDNPSTIEIDPSKITMSANLRYTTNNDWMILKKRNVKKYGFEQYFEICDDLVNRDEYSGVTFSWGDDYISRCANRLVTSGNARTWRQIGSNHHLTMVARQIANLTLP